MLSITPTFWRHRRTSSASTEEVRNQIGVMPVAAQSALSIASTMSKTSATEQAELDSLNASLAVMCSVFPDVRPEVFREILVTFSPESRLQLAVESMLRCKQKLVKGRWRVEIERKQQQHKKNKSHNQQQQQQRRRSSSASVNAHGKLLAHEEEFRTEEYKTAVKAVLYQEFKALSRSTVKGVLAEHNFSYTGSRPTLIALTSKSWRWSLANLFSRRNKSQLPTDHPLLVWNQSKMSGVLEPSLRYTASEELNEELNQTLILPLQRQRMSDQLVRDRKFAQQRNEIEAEEAGAMFDCQCCFTPNTFEAITTCASSGHVICHRCVKLTLSEAIFGQGWAGSVSTTTCSLKCFALSEDGATQDCGSYIPHEQVKLSICVDKEGKETWRKFEDRVSHEVLVSSGLQLSKCAFCSYAEINEPLEEPTQSLSSNYHIIFQISALCLGLAISFLFPILALVSTPSIALVSWFSLNNNQQAKLKLYIQKPSLLTKQNVCVPHHGQRFTCRSPSCSMVSCLRCSAPWQDIHMCHRSSRLALRSHIESAITEAIKRTCPRCHVSFIKASGCNKLVCVCGYSMCYVCRKEIGPREGYVHFCPHFRPNPGEDCMKCDRCDLYRMEDDDVIIERARVRAIKEWKEAQVGRGAVRKGDIDSGSDVRLDDIEEVDIDVDVLDNEEDEEAEEADSDIKRLVTKKSSRSLLSKKNGGTHGGNTERGNGGKRKAAGINFLFG